MVASMVVLCPLSTPRQMEMATLVLCEDIGPKQMLARLHIECADEGHPVYWECFLWLCIVGRIAFALLHSLLSLYCSFHT